MTDSPRCTCGHTLSSHRQDPVDPWATERCKTCGCAAFHDGRASDPENYYEPSEGSET